MVGAQRIDDDEQNVGLLVAGSGARRQEKEGEETETCKGKSAAHCRVKVITAGELDGYPPAMAPTMRSGSVPATTAAGSATSGGSLERSSIQAKKRRNGRRRRVT